MASNTHVTGADGNKVMVVKHSLSSVSCESLLDSDDVELGSKMATLRSAERSDQEAEL